MVEFRVLGPVQLTAEGRPLQLGPAKRQTVLAVLALDVGRSVSVDALVDRVWDEEPPAEARNALYAHITRIRQTLAAARDGSGSDRPRIDRGVGGYTLVAEPDAVDLRRFERLVEEARDVEGVLRAERLREALDLWQGTPLAGLKGAWAAGARESLERRRLNALVLWAASERRLGRQSAVIESLYDTADRFPLAESVVGELMRALHQDGRTGEALDCYARLRRHLVNELGTEPCSELRLLHQTALTGKVPPAAPAEPQPLAVPNVSRPAQLPASPPGFVGRHASLDWLDELLQRPGEDDSAATAPIGVVCGAAGVGKTALAVRWAHSRRGHFAEGQLYVNLGGYAPTPPLQPLDVLIRFLRALGVPNEQVPTEHEEAAALYRSLLAGRRLLVLLDNARDPEQVRPLLPATPGCLVLITSRSQMAGLVAREGARRRTLDVLTAPESRELLVELLGKERVTADSDAGAQLADLCGRLPLALRIAAANLADRPYQSLPDYTAMLAGSDRLTALEVEGDEQTAVRAVFEQSYAALEPEARRFFRLIGLAPVPDLTVESTAALTGTVVAEAARLLRRLRGAHLVEERAWGRFALHDLVHLYAIECAEKEDSADDRALGVVRLLDLYLDAADAAAGFAYPDKLRLPSQADSRTTAFQSRFTDREGALTWLDTERPNLVRVVLHAAEQGPRWIAWRLADTLRGYFWLRMHTAEWLTVAGAGLSSAEAEGDLHGQAAALLSSGDVHRCLSRYRVAIDHYLRAQATSEEAGWLDGQAAAIGNLGNTFERAGRLREAADTHLRALALDRQSGRIAGQAASLANLGSVYLSAGRIREAAETLPQALELDREVGAPGNEAMDLTTLGSVCHALGNHEEARTHLDRAMELHQQSGERDYSGETIRCLAALDCDAGRPVEAREGARTALAQARESGNRRIEADTLNTLADIHRSQGRRRDAVDDYRKALDIARATEERHPEAAALIGLATVHTAMGSPEAAADFARQALVASRNAGYRLSEGRALTALAAALTGAPETAREQAERALAIHRETGYLAGQQETTALLARLPG
ncbi:tetratricopeptide repeat protein [Streptomyces sp. NPDC002920]